jgi:hypothetical protein
MRLRIVVTLMAILEVFVTCATAYQHHSEARWEISATYFGTAIGYVLSRLVIWLPSALVLFSIAKLRNRSFAIWHIAAVALSLEVAVTLGSILLRAKEPSYGIFFSSFLSYLIARAVVWIPLTCMILTTLGRRSRLQLRRNEH